MRTDYHPADGRCIVEIWEPKARHRRCKRMGAIAIGGPFGAITLCRQHHGTILKRGEWVFMGRNIPVFIEPSDLRIKYESEPHSSTGGAAT